MANLDIVFNGGVVDNATVTDTSTEIRPENLNREYLILRNMSTVNTVYLAVGADAELEKGIPIYPREFWEMTTDNLSGAVVNGICEAGKTAKIAIQVGTR